MDLAVNVTAASEVDRPGIAPNAPQTLNPPGVARLVEAAGTKQP